MNILHNILLMLRSMLMARNCSILLCSAADKLSYIMSDFMGYNMKQIIFFANV